MLGAGPDTDPKTDTCMPSDEQVGPPREKTMAWMTHVLQARPVIEVVERSQWTSWRC